MYVENCKGDLPSWEENLHNRSNNSQLILGPKP